MKCSKPKRDAVDLTKICIVLDEYSGSEFALDREKKNYCLRFIRKSYEEVLKDLKRRSWHFTLEPIFTLFYDLGIRMNSNFLDDNDLEASLLRLDVRTGIKPDLKFVEYQDKIESIVDLSSGEAIWSAEKEEKMRGRRKNENKHN